MLKFIGATQLVLAPVLVLPTMTGQEATEHSLESQLEATVMSIEFLAGLRDSAASGVPGAVNSIVQSTEAPRDTLVQRAEKVTALQMDLARLRFGMDKLMADPSHMAAITSMPPSVVRALGLGGEAPTPVDIANIPAAPAGTNGVTAPVPGVPDPAASLQTPGTAHATPGQPAASASNPASMDPLQANPAAGSGDAALSNATVPTGPILPSHLMAGMRPTVGLGDAMREAIRSDIGPLDQVSKESRRRGDEPVPLEDDGYVADPVRLGKLLVRAGRPSEALEVLKNLESHGGRYWLARALQDLDRATEAIAIFEALVADEESGQHGEHAKQDLDFLKFQASFERSKRR